MKKWIRQLHFPPGARSHLKRYTTWSCKLKYFFRPMQIKKKKNPRLQGGGNAYLNFFWERKKKKKEENSTKELSSTATLNRKGIWEDGGESERAGRQRRGRGDAARTPFFPAAGVTMREHPLRITAGNCSQETEVLKLENRCQRK